MVLGLMMLLGFLVRLHGIGQPMVTFHPTRHYRSANIARACYYDASASVPAWAKQVAAANLAMQPAGEPQVMEWLACHGYLLAGWEDIRIPRALAALCWIAGTVPLFGLARRVSSCAVSLVGAALYVFLPYAILATRSFQPDALMTLCALAAVLALVRYFERPGPSRLYTAALLVAVAAVVKPMSVFLTLFAAVGLARASLPWGLLVRNRGVLGLLTLSLAPATLYYGYEALFGTLARDQMRMRFVPALLSSGFFWGGWLTQIRRVFGLPLFIAGLAGALVAPQRGSRPLLVGLWLGYLAFAVAFTYHMPTHDYYHLPYVAVMALSVSAGLERLRVWAGERLAPIALRSVAGAAVAAIAVWGVSQAWPRLTVPRSAETVARYERIGVLTNHDTRVLFLDLEYGYSLMYHGQLSGDAWPNADDLAAEALGGLRPMSADARFARDYARFRPTYFVVTDLASLAAEPDLRQLLAERVVPVEQTSSYHVYRFLER